MKHIIAIALTLTAFAALAGGTTIPQAPVPAPILTPAPTPTPWVRNFIGGY